MWDSPYPHRVLSTMLFLGKHFPLFDSETSLLTPNPVSFPTSFSRLSSVIFGYNQKLNPLSKNEVEKH